MKIVSAQTMQEIDRRAIEECGIAGLDLMERAGRGCVDEILTAFGPAGKAVVVAGAGNNGGDGHVIARLLLQAGWDARVYLLAERSRVSGDAAANLDRLPQGVVESCPHELPVGFQLDASRADVIVDAMLGTGLNCDIGGIYREAVAIINGSGRPVLAVDIPSGIHGTTGRVLGSAVRADITVTFACTKLGHVLYPGADYCGRMVLVDIGIPPHLVETCPGYDLLDRNSVQPLLKPRQRQAHKGDFGHCLIVAGSSGKTGAAALAANSAMRTGSGLVTLAVPESLHAILETKTTEAMTVPLPDRQSGRLTEEALASIEHLLEGKDSLALGPGLGRHPGTTALVRSIVETTTLPLVIDADGLNALADDITILQRKRSPDVVLTPHPGEMARLMGVTTAEVEADRIGAAAEFARRFDVHLVLKGARTVIAHPDGTTAINGSGNPGMASGGMGDVLTGIIGSLLGQSFNARDACRLGVFLHGFAADLVAEDKGERGLIASDVQEMLPYACKMLIGSAAQYTRQ